jgi:hypothetical protein
MTTTTTSRADAAYTRPASRDELMAEAFSCMLGGRAFPERLRPPVVVATCPATVEEGCRRILAGPPSGTA